jgi:hypothetical protein
MNSVVMTAIASSISKMVKNLPSLPVGRHRIDETVMIRVTGEVLKCEDEQYTPTVHIPIKAVLAYLLPSLGATREAQQRKLLEACKAALAADLKIEETITALVKNVDEAFKIVQNEVTGQLPKEVKDGKVIVKCKVEEVGVTAGQAAPCFTTQQIAESV